MINAEITTGNNSYIAKVSGHAGFAPKGCDIVCAGVSALAMALFETASLKVSRDNTAYFSVEVNDGCFEIRALGVREKELSKEFCCMFAMFRAGLERIEEQYPGYLKLNLFEFPFSGNDNDTSEQTMNIE